MSAKNKHAKGKFRPINDYFTWQFIIIHIMDYGMTQFN